MSLMMSLYVSHRFRREEFLLCFGGYEEDELDDVSMLPIVFDGRSLCCVSEVMRKISLMMSLCVYQRFRRAESVLWF